MTKPRTLLARTAALAGVAALALGSLAGCSSPSEPAASDAQASTQAGADPSEKGIDEPEGDLGGIISVDDVKKLMDDGEEFVFLDVRTPEEFAAQHIDGAINLNVEDITAETAGETIASKDTKVVLYCRSGHRAGIALQMLRDLGYTDVASMGAIADWPYGYVEG